LGLKFLVKPADVDEQLPEQAKLAPAQYAETLALRKAEAVAAEHPRELVLGADTIVVLNNRILEKPQNCEHAAKMLLELAGNTHEVITAVALVKKCAETERVGHELTKVHIRDLDRELIDSYVATEEPMDKAGSYAIQGLGSALVEWVHGCFYNVVGLPVPYVVKELEQFGVHMSEVWTGVSRRVPSETEPQ
jgi:septum formation protein